MQMIHPFIHSFVCFVVRFMGEPKWECERPIIGLKRIGIHIDSKTLLICEKEIANTLRIDIDFVGLKKSLLKI